MYFLTLVFLNRFFKLVTFCPFTFKLFLTGKDPLAGLNHWKDINAVAGVLRAYFRELEEPLFPSKFCDDYIRISRKIPCHFLHTESAC